MTDNGDPDAIMLNEDRLAAFCTTRVTSLTGCFLATMGMFMNDLLLSPEGKVGGGNIDRQLQTRISP